MAAAAIPALVAAGGDVRSKDSDGDQPLHGAIKRSWDSKDAAVAAAALIAAGADPQAPDGQGRLPVELALEPQCGPQCAELLRVLLGEAAEEAAASGAGPSKAAGQAAANGAGPSNSSRSGVQQVLKLAAAAIRQLAKGKRPAEPAQPAARECPVCLEPGACMTGPCGHLVCEGCATKDQVRTGR